jgi:putative aminopeptidase FrvX
MTHEDHSLIQENRVKDLICRLTGIDSPPGREQAVREAVERHVEGIADRTEFTPLGNLHATCNPGGRPKITLMANMDEVGLIVSHIDQRGFAHFQPLGALGAEACVGHLARFPGKGLALIQEAWRQVGEKTSFQSLVLDFGARAAADCPVAIGDIGVVAAPTLDFGSRLAGKALDNRVGVAILIEVLRRTRRPKAEIHALFTVQGHAGQRGAQTLPPELADSPAIMLGLTPCDGKVQADLKPVALGEGPVLQVMLGGLPADAESVELLRRQAQEMGVAYQVRVEEADARSRDASRLVAMGLRILAVGVPCRYADTPSPMIDLGDVENAADLLAALVSTRLPS